MSHRTELAGERSSRPARWAQVATSSGFSRFLQAVLGVLAIALCAACSSNPDSGSGLASAWLEGSAAPEPLYMNRVAAVSNRLYLSSNPLTSQMSVRVHIFDPATNTWSDAPPLPDQRDSGAWLGLGADLYLFGGVHDYLVSWAHDAWVLRAGASAWVSVKPLAEEMGVVTGAVVDGRVLLLAVAIHETDRYDVVEYDPTSDTYTTLSQAPHEAAAAVGLAGRLYLFGEHGVDTFDPKTKVWGTAPSAPGVRAPSVAATATQIFSVGGLEPGGENPVAETSVLSASSDWQASDPLPAPRSFAAAAVVHQRLFAIGGLSGPASAGANATTSVFSRPLQGP